MPRDDMPGTKGLGGRWRSHGAYLPLAAAILALPWAAVVLLTPPLAEGRLAEAEKDLRHLYLLAAVPGIVGLLLAGLVWRSAPPAGLIQRFCLLVGAICCAAISFSFVWTYCHWSRIVSDGTALRCRLKRESASHHQDRAGSF